MQTPGHGGCVHAGVLSVELGGGAAQPGWVPKPSTHPEVQHPSCRLINCQLIMVDFADGIRAHPGQRNNGEDPPRP